MLLRHVDNLLLFSFCDSEDDDELYHSDNEESECYCDETISEYEDTNGEKVPFDYIKKVVEFRKDHRILNFHLCKVNLNA